MKIHLERIAYDDDEEQWNKHRDLCDERAKLSTLIDWKSMLAKLLDEV